MMNAYSYMGQSVWFAFGTWAGVVTWTLVDVIQGNEFKIRSIVDDGSFLPYFIALFVPCAMLLTVRFMIWQAFRSWCKKVPTATPWLAPLLAGLLYLPIVAAMIPVLCTVTNQGQGLRIGTAVCVLFFGLPAVFAEICLRVGQTMTQHYPPSSNSSGDTSENAT
jgi:hypothetical protein